MRVISDIVRRYDIDGIHLDDYFYPYVETNSQNQPIPFPDDATYSKYSTGAPRDDWRRANVDRFVERLYREVHTLKPTLKVGISPFGIWRPGFPPSVQGLDAYASIYADSRKWLQQGWVDYFAPQLYWPSPRRSRVSLRCSMVGRAEHRGTACVAGSRCLPGSGRNVERVFDSGNSKSDNGGASENLGKFSLQHVVDLKRNSGRSQHRSRRCTRPRRSFPRCPGSIRHRRPAPAISVASSAIQITPGSGELHDGGRSECTRQPDGRPESCSERREVSGRCDRRSSLIAGGRSGGQC
jgi:hypothetical protein